MTKLINAFRANPTPANRTKIERYMRSHPLALCFVTIEDIAFLRDSGFQF